MDPQVQRIFVSEITRQSNFGLLAYSGIQNALRSNDPQRVWYSVQALLVAAGNVSKLFWPPDKKCEARGADLRSAFSVKDNSPLAPRTFRNHFEHFDERLERWATDSSTGNFVDSNIGPPNMVVGLEPAAFMRNFDNTNFVVTFRGDNYPLNPIAEGLQNVIANTPA